MKMREWQAFDIPADHLLIIDKGAFVDIYDALLSILNVEGPARLGARCKAYCGLDVRYHFDKVRAAIWQIKETQKLNLGLTTKPGPRIPQPTSK